MLSMVEMEVYLGNDHAFYGCNVGMPGNHAMLSVVVMFNMPGMRPCFLWL